MNYGHAKRAADRELIVIMGHLWRSFSSQSRNDAVHDVRGRTARYCGNTINLVKHLRFHHSTDYEEIMQRWCKEADKEGSAKTDCLALQDIIKVKQERESVAIGNVYHGQ